MINREEKRNHLKSFIPMAEFIAKVSGPRCETVLRDYHDGESTILFMANGFSGRKVGDTISGYPLRKIMKPGYEEKDFVANYIIVNESNLKILRASTFFIRKDDETVGLLSVNYDISELLKYREYLDSEVLYGFEENKSLQREYFDDSMEDIVEGMIKNVFVYRDETVPVNRTENESNPIRQLYKLGIFNYRGTVSRVAELLNISTQTVYRYIKEIEREGE